MTKTDVEPKIFTDHRFGVTRDFLHVVQYNAVHDRWLSDLQVSYKTDEVTVFPETCGTVEAALQRARDVLLDSRPHVEVNGVQLHVSETISTGEVATQLKRIFTITTMDDSLEMLYYKGGVYLSNAEAVLKGTVQKAYEVIGLHDQPTSHFLSEVLGHLERSSYVNRREFDKDQHILNVKNGLFNMQTGELEPHDPNYLSRKQLAVAYNPTAECPKILEFLRQVQPDEADQQAVIEHASVPLLKSNFLQKAFMYIGKGRNGKSIWFEILNLLYGDENIRHVSIHALVTNRFAPARLDGKMLNIHDDISSQEIRQTGITKQIIAGNPIEVEDKGIEGYTMQPPHPILYFSANQLPEVEDLSDAWMRRWEQLDWLQQFDIEQPTENETAKQPTENETARPSTDRLIAEKIATPEEVEGLLLWLIRTARFIRENQRLTRESTISQVREEWVRRSDITLTFLKATIEADSQAYISKDELLSEYVQYCKKKDYLPKSTKAFVIKLRENYAVADFRSKVGSERVNCWRGIKHVNRQNTLGGTL